MAGAPRRKDLLGRHGRAAALGTHATKLLLPRQHGIDKVAQGSTKASVALFIAILQQLLGVGHGERSARGLLHQVSREMLRRWLSASQIDDGWEGRSARHSSAASAARCAHATT